MRTERNLVIYAGDPDVVARYLIGFGLRLEPEGHDHHWCAEAGDDTVHVCMERRHDLLRVPDEPGVHGVWHYLTHKQYEGASAES